MVTVIVPKAYKSHFVRHLSEACLQNIALIAYMGGRYDQLKTYSFYMSV